VALLVAAIQHDIAWEDRDATLRRLEPRVAQAADDGARLLVLPETFAVGFSMDTGRIAEPVDGPTSDWLAGQAAAHDVWIGGSVPERRAGAERPGNVFVLCAPDGQRHRYAKRHPFSYGGEAERYEAGDELLTVAVDGVRVSPAICYDLRFADQLWSQADATDCYLVVACWPARRMAHWRPLLVARAIENLAYVVGVNRVGTAGDGARHEGGSCAIDPWGEVVAEVGAEEAALLVEVDPARVAATRERYPFLRDRR
jgi:predicted amidohydrolase